MLDDNQVVPPGEPGDDGDAALDAALAAADEDVLAAISRGLDLDTGLARILTDLDESPAARLGVQARAAEDAAPGEARWRRLEAAMRNRLQGDRAPSSLIRFITDVMEPGRHPSAAVRLSALRDSLTETLALVGLKITERGQAGRAARTATLDEAARLAARLHAELTRRGAHERALAYCDDELMRGSLFHAVSEAAEGLAVRLRALSGSGLGGPDLVDYCFTAQPAQPVIRINPYASAADRSEHAGLASLLRGILGTFRNPAAHAPQATAEWTITEADALDLFSTLSFIHRRLDHAIAQP